MGSRLMSDANASSLDQQKSNSSLESTESSVLDGNRALSTSCSEDSFEMSGTISKPTTDNSSRTAFQSSNLKLSFSNSENPIQSSEIVSKSLDRRISSYNNLKQVCRDDLKSRILYEKSDMIKKVDSLGKMDSLSSINCQFDNSNGQNVQEECRAFFQNKIIQNNIMSSHDSLPEGYDGSIASKSANFVANDDCSGNSQISLRECIDKELSNLDTCLPQLDFNRLEEKLNFAAQERLTTERKLLGEQVRRRLAIQVDQCTPGSASRFCAKPSRSSLGFRLQTAMNLQVCYINDLKDEDDEEEESSDDDLYVPKSKSVPNLHTSVSDGSSFSATKLCQTVSSIKEKRLVIEEETKLMLAKAKQAAKMQMEIEKMNMGRSSTATLPKASRLHLAKMTCKQLVDISKQLSKRIDKENAELMRLLMEKDSLHMQQDSMLVDIEDMIQHESNSESLNLPDFLKVQPGSPLVTSKFRIFKR